MSESPGVGEVIAQRIVNHREKSGKFRKVDELLVIRGISRKKLEKLRPLITVGEVEGKTQALPIPADEVVGADRNGGLLQDADAEAFQSGDLAGVVGEQADVANPEVAEDLGADAGLALNSPLLGERVVGFAVAAVVVVVDADDVVVVHALD